MDTSHNGERKELGRLDVTAPSQDAVHQIAPGALAPLVERVASLDDQQQQALEWLVSTENPTVKDAAEFAGVSRSTVSRWLNDDPNFIAAYTAWREQQAKVNEAHMAGLEASALNVLAEAVRQRRDLRAAMFVIRQMMVERRQQQK